MKKVRWGILSTANIARTQFIPAIFRAENAEVTAIASRGSKVHAIAQEFNIPKAYESYEALLNDPEIDAVYIPLPNHLHKEWVIKAARKGKHILCEKPVSLNAEEAVEMDKITLECNVKFMEAFMYQFHPQHDRVREIILSGEIGEVKLFKSSHSFYLENREDDIRMVKEMGGGSLYDVGCYSIHAVRYILNTEPIEVHAIGNIDPISNVDLSAYVHMKLENGVTALMDCSFDMTERNEYEVVGTKGTIKVPYAFRPDRNGGVGIVIVERNGVTREEKIHGDIYRLEVEHFSRAILEDLKVKYSGESSIKNMRVIDACYESIRTGKSIRINQ
ncbi:putative dehydrogenase [Anoxybacillus vitaminiphilus]|uniref:Putative dehydrogenase n=1 Tax=Paranoxybacillus vitaminiphilus TaxID=581036 RepID=A0A327YHA2_9BACL|nr:Gfo/Idh/MocA family oxidoreductase [Anoxybacillus vitaminiphilus]RAK20360.1 putative dehydrogenase [Anoxybacillus vitaminiphilus]